MKHIKQNIKDYLRYKVKTNVEKINKIIQTCKNSTKKPILSKCALKQFKKLLPLFNCTKEYLIKYKQEYITKWYYILLLFNF
jgi:hypothetical protein